MAEESNNRVFLSYAHENLDMVRRIYAGLRVVIQYNATGKKTIMSIDALAGARVLDPRHGLLIASAA